ncbi:MAG: OmpA family protein [Deltaproteobacteria bacterium]|nr:OmpA family protein [Deltaproteobacteria bacterium]
MHTRRWTSLAVAAAAMAVILPATSAPAAPESPPEEQVATTGPAEEAPRPDPAEISPSISGLSGLFRVVSTQIGRPHTFRVGLHTEIFSGKSFLVSGDSNSRFIGSLALNYTPWRLLEFYMGVRSTANSNDRRDPARQDQRVILALGDFGFGGKFQYPVFPAWGIGLNLGVQLMNSVGGVSVEGAATGVTIGLISTVDLGAVTRVPWRFHVNVGYQLDNSGRLSAFPGHSLQSLQVEKFALGINPSRMQLRFGTDVSLRKWTKIGLTPLAELGVDIATTTADADFNQTRFIKPNGPLSTTDIDGRASAWLTLGLRASPLRGLGISLATDLGLLSPGYGYGPPVVPWNLILGLSYSYEPGAATRVVTRERVVVKSQPAADGKVRGRVVNAKSLEPIEGAVVTFPGRDLTGQSTDPDGTFLSYGFTAGKVNVMVRHPDYQPAKLAATVTGANSVAKVEIKLEPAAPKLGKLSGKVTDLKGAGVASSIVLTGPESRTVTSDASGAFAVELKPGAYTAQVTAEGFIRKDAVANVAPAGPATMDVTLSARPKRSQVKLTKSAIVITKNVHFATGTANLMPDSQQLLDEVAEVMQGNPKIRKVEVGGHTDNRGAPKGNEQLSQARADAVRDYLLKAGVAADRLTAKGYGPHQPKAPNITPRNRATNRRVEFKILEQ